MRVALRFAYDGRFPGYARQPEGGTVEDHLIAALVHEGYVERSWRTGSRTDRGVCAAMNVATCELDRAHVKGLVPALQPHLPQGIWVTGAAVAPDGFDPRRALWRQYAYVAPRGDEELDRLVAAAAAFVGEHDMTAFARVEDREPRRTVLECTVAKGDWWRFTIRGHAFLWNQVRRMVDAMLRVGAGEASIEDIQAALETGTPHRSFGVAAPEGLLLEEVAYDIAWDPAAGALHARRLVGERQEVAVRAALLQDLSASA